MIESELFFHDHCSPYFQALFTVSRHICSTLLYYVLLYQATYTPSALLCHSILEMDLSSQKKSTCENMSLRDEQHDEVRSEI